MVRPENSSGEKSWVPVQNQNQRVPDKKNASKIEKAWAFT